MVVAIVNRPQGRGVERGHVVDQEAIQIATAGDFQTNCPGAIHTLGNRVGHGMTVFFRGSDHQRYVVGVGSFQSENDWLGKRLITWGHACELWIVNDK